MLSYSGHYKIKDALITLGFFYFFTLMHADMSQILSSIGPMGPKDSYLLLAKDVCYGIGWVRKKKKLISVNSVIISASTNTFIFTYI